MPACKALERVVTCVTWYARGSEKAEAKFYVSPEKTEKTHRNWVADARGRVWDSPVVCRRGEREASQHSRWVVPLWRDHFAPHLPGVGSVGQGSQGRRFRRRSAPRQQHKLQHSLLACPPGHASRECLCTEQPLQLHPTLALGDHGL